MRSRLAGVALATTTLALGLTACGSNDGGGAQPAADGKINVVTSTNVWGSVAAAVGGDKVAVKPLINDPAGDPHSYASTAEDAVTVRSAQLTLSNGGGYDDFFAKLTEQAPNVRKLVAFDISGKQQQPPQPQPAPAQEPAGHDHEHGHEGEAGAGHESHQHGEVNEHVWYDLPTVQKVADQVATQLGELKPEAKQAFTDNANAFKGKVAELIGRVEGIGATPDTKVLATEPVAHYLLDTAKVTDATPKAFADAIENESDVPPAALDEAQRLVAGKQVRAVINNAQTTTPVTSRVVDGARAAGLPVVDVTETLPAGQTDYVAWMGNQVNALVAALRR